MKRAGPALLLVAALTVAGISPATAASRHHHHRGHHHGGGTASGVRGVVLAGPVCPVEHIPPDPNCAPRPIVAHLTLSRGGGGGAGLAHTTSAGDGTFEISAAPGHYTLSATTSQAMFC